MSKCETCKWKTAGDGWAMCDQCVHDPALKDQYKPFTAADRIRAMTDEELAWYLARMLAIYTAELYDRQYVPSDETVCEIKDNLLRQLQSPAESPTGQKG